MQKFDIDIQGLENNSIATNKIATFNVMGTLILKNMKI
jgi:hypothetical protein